MSNSAPSPEQICETFTTLLTYLVDDKSAITVHPIADGVSTRLEVRCAPADLGKLIGKQGRTARALRVILVAVGQKSGAYTLDIAEAGDSLDSLGSRRALAISE